MKTLLLAQLILSKAEKGLWYDHDERAYDPTGWGICLKLYAGMVWRPIPKPAAWLSLLRGNPALSDAWNDFNPDQHWMIKFPCICPFVSVAFRAMGFYAGFKTFDFENERYRKWPSAPFGGLGLTPSISTRLTRWK